MERNSNPEVITKLLQGKRKQEVLKASREERLREIIS